MQVLLIYDIKNKQEQVKQKLLAIGYTDNIEGTNGKTNLPETTLYREFTDKGANCENALHDIQEITDKLNIELIRVIAVDFDNWIGIIEEPDKMEGKNKYWQKELYKQINQK